MEGLELLDCLPSVDLPLGDVDAEPVPRRAEGSLPAAPLGEWLALVAARQEQAMLRLHRAIAPRVSRVVTRIVPDAHLADEVIGDCMWQVWREASRFDATRGTVLSWVATIARSRALDAMRRRKALARYEEPISEELLTTWACDDADPPTRLAERQRDVCLRAALARIDPIQRQVLSLAFVAGLSHEQVAKHSGMALGTVKSHIRRGLAQMHKHCAHAGLRS